MRIYKFTNETKTFGKIKLTRIKRIKDGQLGGFIEKENNVNNKQIKLIKTMVELAIKELNAKRS